MISFILFHDLSQTIFFKDLRVDSFIFGCTGPCCCPWAFSGCGKWTSHCCAFSYCGFSWRAGAPGTRASVVVVCRFCSCCSRALVATQHEGSSRTRNWTHVPCIGRQILNHWITREALPQTVKCQALRSPAWTIRKFPGASDMPYLSPCFCPPSSSLLPKVRALFITISFI